MAILRKNWSSIIGNCMKAMQRYRNWPEIIISFAKEQAPTRLILKDGTKFEWAGGMQNHWRGR